MESAEVNFGSTVPQFVKDELSLWIDYIQNDVDGDGNDVQATLILGIGSTLPGQVGSWPR